MKLFLLLLLISLAVVTPAAVADESDGSAVDKARFSKFNPTVSIDIGVAGSWYSTEHLQESATAIEDLYGIPHIFHPTTGQATGTAGLRFHPTPFAAVRLQGMFRRTGENIVGVSHIGLSLLIRPVRLPYMSVWLGGGVARQSLVAKRTYNYWIDSLGGTLESVEIQTQAQTAYPVDLLLELHERSTPQRSLLLGVKRIFAPIARVDYSPAIRADMDAWVISVSLSSGI